MIMWEFSLIAQTAGGETERRRLQVATDDLCEAIAVAVHAVSFNSRLERVLVTSWSRTIA